MLELVKYDALRYLYLESYTKVDSRPSMVVGGAVDGGGGAVETKNVVSRFSRGGDCMTKDPRGLRIHHLLVIGVRMLKVFLCIVVDVTHHCNV